MKKHPNILFFGIDSLRSDHMSLYGYKRLTTPHIDAFIEDGGITFDKMYSPSRLRFHAHGYGLLLNRLRSSPS